MPWRRYVGRIGDQTISEIWNGAEYDAFRAVLASDTPPSICRGCSVYRGTF